MSDVVQTHVLMRTKRKFRCSKGHEWETRDGDTQNLNLIANSLPPIEKVVCFRCFIDMMVANCGTVEEIESSE